MMDTTKSSRQKWINRLGWLHTTMKKVLENRL